LAHYPRKFSEDRESVAAAYTTEKEQRNGCRQDGQTRYKVHVLRRSKPMGSLKTNPVVGTQPDRRCDAVNNGGKPRVGRTAPNYSGLFINGSGCFKYGFTA